MLRTSYSGKKHQQHRKRIITKFPTTMDVNENVAGLAKKFPDVEGRILRNVQMPGLG